MRERLGTRPLQSITKSDIEDLVDWMLTAGRRRGGKPGTGLSGRTARLTLSRFSAALEAAVLEGKLVRNVARLVKPPRAHPAGTRDLEQGGGQEVPGQGVGRPAVRRVAPVAVWPAPR